MEYVEIISKASSSEAKPPCTPTRQLGGLLNDNIGWTFFGHPLLDDPHKDSLATRKSEILTGADKGVEIDNNARIASVRRVEGVGAFRV